MRAFPEDGGIREGGVFNQKSKGGTERRSARSSHEEEKLNGKGDFHEKGGK